MGKGGKKTGRGKGSPKDKQDDDGEQDQKLTPLQRVQQETLEEDQVSLADLSDCFRSIQSL